MTVLWADEFLDSGTFLEKHSGELMMLLLGALVFGTLLVLVPMVVVCAAGTVTCFLVAYRSENLFAVALAVWSVAGVVSLAAITGGVALLGRLAQLHSGEEEEAGVPSPMEK